MPYESNDKMRCMVIKILKNTHIHILDAGNILFSDVSIEWRFAAEKLI